MACPLGPVWPPFGRGPSPGPRMAAVVAWPVPWASYGRRGGETHLLGPVWRREGVAHPMGPVWPTWRRGPSPGLRLTAVQALPFHWAPSARRGGVARSLGLVCMPWGRGPSRGLRLATWGRGLSSGPRMAAVGTWPVSWAPSGCRGCVARPLCPVWRPWGRCPSPGPCHATVGAWPVPWAPSGCLGGVDRPLGFVLPPWGRGSSPGSRLVVVGACAVPYILSRRRGGVVCFLRPVGRREGVARPLGTVLPPWGCGPSPGPCMAALGA